MSYAFETKSEKWLNRLVYLGHSPKMILEGDTLELDIFALENGLHNGPQCLKCGIGWCWHCSSLEELIPCSNIQLELNLDV